MAKKSLLAMALVFSMILVPLSAWAVPQLVNYQGRLTDSGGTPLDGVYLMIFSLYELETGGSDIWDEQQSVTVTDGIYSVELGSENDFPAGLFGDYPSLYLQVEIFTTGEGWETLSPRQHLTSTAFSMMAAKAEDAETLDGKDSTEFSELGHDHSFGEITGTATDSQIPDDITIDYAATSAYAYSADSATTAGSADYATTASDADTVDGYDATDFAEDIHQHSGGDITTGTVADAFIAASIARDSEIMPTVLAGDGPGSSLNADLLDNLQASAFALSSHSHEHGDMTGLGDDDHSQYFHLSQSETVSGRPYFNGGTSGSTPPFYVDSTYRVSSLNADLLDGYDSSSFANSSHSHDSRYYTESESDSRFVNTTGDSITGSIASPSAVLTVTNNGTGDGIEVSSAGANGIHVLNPGGDGVYVYGAGDDGVALNNVGDDGVSVQSPGDDGVTVTNPADDGVSVSGAGDDGFAAYDAADDGVYVYGAGDDGVYVESPGSDGVSVQNAGYSGVYVSNATLDGIHVNTAGSDGIQIINALHGLWATGMTDYGVYAGGGTAGARFEDSDSGTYTLIAWDSYGIYSNGTKNFVQEHPTRSDQVIIYAALEGGEAGTYCRGTAQLANGTATIDLPEHFSLVTEEEGLTVQVTPRAECNGLYVAEVTTTSIVVKELQAGRSNARFDFFINGIRSGYADYKVINSKTELGLDEMEEARQEKERQEAERRAERESERERERKAEQEKRQKEEQRRELERKKRQEEQSQKVKKTG